MDIFICLTVTVGPSKGSHSNFGEKIAGVDSQILILACQEAEIIIILLWDLYIH